MLEIWPSGHHSPVHDHGNACAVIKVLYGDGRLVEHWALLDNLGMLKQVGALPA